MLNSIVATSFLVFLDDLQFGFSVFTETIKCLTVSAMLHAYIGWRCSPMLCVCIVFNLTTFGY